MRSAHTSRMFTVGSIALIGLAALSCTDAPSAVTSESSHLTAHASAANAKSSAKMDARGLAQSVKSTTARFHSTTQATKAGYAVNSPCVAHPTLGTMGFHWVNQGLVDPVFDAMQPEAVLYAPDKNGNLKLVAVEYIVINVGQPAPTFDGQAFDVGGTPVPVPHWSLHVWAHETNPNGLFTPFNPAVSCNGQ